MSVDCKYYKSCNAADYGLNALINNHFVDCAHCKGKGKLNPETTTWIFDSGASMHCTSDINDFHFYRNIPKEKRRKVLTAAKGNSLEIVGVGSVAVTTVSNNKKYTHLI